MVTEEPIVLCVDDERGVLSALRRLLVSEPYRLVTVQRPMEALEWARMGGVRVVVVDQRMPDMAGTDLLRALRKIDPTMARVMMTAYPDREVLRERMSRAARERALEQYDKRALAQRTSEAVRRMVAAWRPVQVVSPAPVPVAGRA